MPARSPGTVVDGYSSGLACSKKELENVGERIVVEVTFERGMPYVPSALLAGRTYGKVSSKAKELLEWLGLGRRLAHRPKQLSGGEMQRTAIARALINDPAVVLADEPTGNLDSANARKVMALLADLNRRLERTVVVATHSDMADEYATMSLRLRDGRVIP